MKMIGSVASQLVCLPLVNKLRKRTITHSSKIIITMKGQYYDSNIIYYNMNV